MELRLYTRWQNSAGERVRIALALKNLPYVYVATSSLAPGEYRRLNPQGLLPALGVGNRIIAQSVAILDFLEERFPQPSLLPEDPTRRGEAKAFSALIASEMHALTVQRVRTYLTNELSGDASAVERWVHHWLSLGFRSLEQTLLARDTAMPFCFGATPGWADLHLVPQMAAARRLGLDLSAFPSLLAVEENCREIEAFRVSRPESQPDYPG